MIHMILREAYVNLVVRHSGISYLKKIGKEFDPARMMKQAARGEPYTDTRPQVTVTRLIIERNKGTLMPPIHISIGKLSELKRYADNETKDLFTVGSSNHGNYLLEFPEKRLSVAVALRFLKWLDENMRTVPARTTSEKVEVGNGGESD